MTNQLHLKSYMMFAKWSSFCNIKERTHIAYQYFVGYEIINPGCGANYVGKTKKKLICVEHEQSNQYRFVKNHLEQ